MNTFQEVIRIGVVDDHPLFRDGLVSRLCAEANIDVVGTGENADDAIEIAKETLPDLILLDLRMPGGGISATRQIAISCPVVRVGILTVSELEDDVIQALKAGADGYILKGVGGLELVSIISDLYHGERSISPEIASKVLEHADSGHSYLSTQETKVLHLLKQGMTSFETAEVLNLSEKSVKSFINNSIQKLQIFSRAERANNARLYL